MKARDTMTERQLCLYAIDKLKQESTVARLAIYDHIFDRLQTNMSEGTHKSETEKEMHLLLAEAAIKFDF